MIYEEVRLQLCLQRSINDLWIRLYYAECMDNGVESGEMQLRGVHWFMMVVERRHSRFFYTYSNIPAFESLFCRM